VAPPRRAPTNPINQVGKASLVVVLGMAGDDGQTLWS